MTARSSPLPVVARAEPLLLEQRWQRLLGMVPPLEPLVAQLLGRRRLSLQARLEAAAVDRALQSEATRWLEQFEAMPQFAVEAVGTLLANETSHRTPEPIADSAAAGEGQLSPERAVVELQTLISDPAFALAFYCVESRLLPRLLLAITPAVERVPKEVWLGLLHAMTPQPPILTAEVAVGLVLRVRSASWASLPASVRQASLRIALASPRDLRAQLVVAQLCARLPASWQQTAETAPAFAATASSLRDALADTSALCGRVVAATRARSGGLSALEAGDAPPAAPAELADLARAARQFSTIPGFARLLDLL